MPWKKTSEELPEDLYGKIEFSDYGTRCLIWCDDWYDSLHIFSEPRKATYWHGRFIIDGCLGDHKVTHWMLLPEKPKKE